MEGFSRAVRRRGIIAVLVTSVMLLASAAVAEGRVQFLADRLAYPPAPGQKDDFRVRTNAALALGATDDDQAVQPLCSGLGDPVEVVRQAVAVALKRLGRESAVDCLKDRAAHETSTSVKAEIRRTMDAIAAAHGGAGGGTGEVPGAKYYVVVARAANHTTRPATEVDALVRQAVASQLASSGEYQVARADEAPEAAKAAVAKRQLKGYYLATSVEKFEYSDDGLRVRVKMAVFSFPGKDLRGEVPAAAMLPGTRPGDTSAENQLLGATAGRAAELFAQNFK